ncbi:hypothetical protein DSO57_1021388 [Entomophthora muscae]|uniref:Uncharacterized protein n=1 Tax=Entomophthora muscae TaxID=34485 RepID=A0ACC2S5L3_9FUNG|nr:hypothetical protein DSO57_1021388 [Entomophthora muscae]
MVFKRKKSDKKPKKKYFNLPGTDKPDKFGETSISFKGVLAQGENTIKAKIYSYEELQRRKQEPIEASPKTFSADGVLKKLEAVSRFLSTRNGRIGLGAVIFASILGGAFKSMEERKRVH